MYPPPSESIVQKLKTQVLDVVSFCRYIIHLNFESGIQLSIEGPFRFAKKQSYPDVPVCEFPIVESNLTRILGQSVVKVNCDTDGTLELEFANEDVLVIYANDPMYEAYTLIIDGKNYVV